MQYIPKRITFDNYVAIWTQSGFPTLVFNSFVVTATTVVLGALATRDWSEYVTQRDTYKNG